MAITCAILQTWNAHSKNKHAWHQVFMCALLQLTHFPSNGQTTHTSKAFWSRQHTNDGICAGWTWSTPRYVCHRTQQLSSFPEHTRLPFINWGLKRETGDLNFFFPMEFAHDIVGQDSRLEESWCIFCTDHTYKESSVFVLTWLIAHYVGENLTISQAQILFWHNSVYRVRAPEYVDVGNTSHAIAIIVVTRLCFRSLDIIRVLDDDQQVVLVWRHHDFMLLGPYSQEGKIVLRSKHMSAIDGEKEPARKILVATMVTHIMHRVYAEPLVISFLEENKEARVRASCEHECLPSPRMTFQAARVEYLLRDQALSLHSEPCYTIVWLVLHISLCRSDPMLCV